MKKILYFLSFVLLAAFSACTEGTNFDINYTPIAPIGGQYRVNIERGYDPTLTDEQYWKVKADSATFFYKTDGTGFYKGVVYAYLTNTTDYDTDKAWLRVGSYISTDPYAINVKVPINMNDYTFGGVGLDDYIGNSAEVTDKVTISGYCGHNTYKTASGTVTDQITVIYSRSDEPGYHYRVTGFKYTGWSEDKY